MNFIYEILGTVLNAIYKIIPDFGWSIIIFTAIIRLLLLPLTIKQQRSMVNMQKIQPELEKIQKKYANDKEKLSQETMKIYQENNINPMGGCLPLLIQMPILIAVYNVIQKPVTYLLKIDIPSKVFDALKGAANTAGVGTELDIVAFVNNNIDKANEALQKAGQSFDLSKLQIDFDFLGLNIGLTPKTGGDILLYIIPVVCVITSFLVSKVGQMGQPKKSENAQASQMNMMMYIFPFMTGYFCMILPAAMGIYWIAGNILQMIQTVVLNKIMNKNSNEPLVIENDKKNKSEKKKK